MRGLPLLVAAVLLTGCAAPPPAAAPPPRSSLSLPPATATASATFNDADVMFLQMMLPHHAQAVAIAELTKFRASRKDLRDLAAAVEATQRTESETMANWLKSWNRSTAVNPDPAAHAHHGGMPATAQDVIEALTRTAGATFDRDAVNVLTGHQHGAVEMARTVLKDGKNPQVKELAERIVQSRTAQVQQLLALLGN